MTDQATIPGPDSLLLRGGTVFDGRTRLGTRDVLIVGGRVAAVRDHLDVRGDTRIIDCHDDTVMPGLIDAHVHLAWAGVDPPPADVTTSRARAAHNAEQLLQAGVTTARDTGGPLEVLGPLTADLARGDTRGPDVLHCGRILCAPDGHGTEIPVPVTIARECAGPDGFRAGVREQLAGGARFVKVALNGAVGRVELTRRELMAVIDEAHAAGVRVACHASVRDAVALAVSCGVDTIEHGNGLDLELAREMAAKHMALVPTVAIFGELREQFENSDDGLLPPRQRAAHRRAIEQRLRDHAPAIAAAVNVEVTLGFGTDRVPGGTVVAVAAEARALHGHGLTPIQIMRAATSGNAQVLGLTDRGTIRAGARADIAVFHGDPTTDLDLLQSPVLVLQGTDANGANHNRRDAPPAVADRQGA